MKRRGLRILTWLAMLAGGGTLFQAFSFTGTGGGGNFGCQRFATNSIASSIDFCYIFDCTNGFFGGVVDPCNDPSIGGAWLLDCPNATPGTATDETDETNGTNQNTTNSALQSAFGGLAGGA